MNLPCLLTYSVGPRPDEKNARHTLANDTVKSHRQRAARRSMVGYEDVSVGVSQEWEVLARQFSELPGGRPRQRPTGSRSPVIGLDYGLRPTAG